MEGQSDGQVVRVRVGDDGPGVPAEVRERIFDPYVRGERPRGVPSSVGLGLYVARRLPRLMGGDLAYRREGDRTVFELTLPAAHPEAATAIGPTSAEVEGVLGTAGLEMAFQPILDLGAWKEGAERIAGLEALARFSDGASPAERFATARRAGVGADLELAAVGAAIGCVDELPRGTYMAFNLSAETLTDGRLLEVLESVDPERVVFELREAEVLGFEYEAVRDASYGVRALGFRLAVDDVGADEVNMRRLMGLEPDIIKLDLAMVRNIDSITESKALAAAAVPWPPVSGLRWWPRESRTRKNLRSSSPSGSDGARGSCWGDR